MRRIELLQGEVMTFNGITHTGPKTVHLRDDGIHGTHADAINSLNRRVESIERECLRLIDAVNTLGSR